MTGAMVQLIQFLPCATKLRRLCFYTCLSVHMRVCLSAYWDTTPPPQKQAYPLGADPSGASIPPEQAPLPQQTATVAAGMHPTGMHSCNTKYFAAAAAAQNRVGTHLLAVLLLQVKLPQNLNTPHICRNWTFLEI